MPGLLFKGPRSSNKALLELDPPNSSSSLAPHFDESPFPPCISPLTPSKSKPCRPSQLQALFNLTKSSDSSDPQQCSIVRQSSDNEHDLAAMVHDFIENSGRDSLQCDSDGDNNGSGSSSLGLTKLCDNLKALGSSNSAAEAELLASVTSLLLSLNEESIVCQDEARRECKGACFRHVVVKRLKSLGYDAAICKLKWEISGNVPGGDYEYVDVLFAKDGRVILDLDFRSQFEIARPTQHYRAVLKLLPTVFVGSVSKLHQVLEIMSEAAKCSLTQNSLHLPPWRTIEYFFAKWFSPHERSSSKVVPLVASSNWKEGPTEVESKPCWEQARRIKEGLRADAEQQSSSSQKRGRRGLCLTRKKTNKW